MCRLPYRAARLRRLHRNEENNGLEVAESAFIYAMASQQPTSSASIGSVSTAKSIDDYQTAPSTVSTDETAASKFGTPSSQLNTAKSPNQIPMMETPTSNVSTAKSPAHSPTSNGASAKTPSSLVNVKTANSSREKMSSEAEVKTAEEISTGSKSAHKQTPTSNVSTANSKTDEPNSFAELEGQISTPKSRRRQIGEVRGECVVHYESTGKITRKKSKELRNNPPQVLKNAFDLIDLICDVVDEFGDRFEIVDLEVDTPRRPQSSRCYYSSYRTKSQNDQRGGRVIGPHPAACSCKYGSPE